MTWSTFNAVYSSVLSTGVYFLLMALVPPEDFGVIAAAGIVMLTLQLLVTAGFAEVLIQRRELAPEATDTAFWTSMGMSAVLGGLLVLSARPLAALFDADQLAPVVSVLAVQLPMYGLQSVPRALLEREMRFRQLTVRTVVATTIGAGVGVGMALAGLGVWALVGQQIGTAVASTAALWASVRWRPGFRGSWKELRGLLAFSGHIVGTRLVDLANGRSEQFLIGAFLGVHALGLYAVAMRIVNLLLGNFYTALGSATLPSFSKLQDSPERLAAALVRAVSMVQIVAMPAFVGLSVLADQIVLLFGEEWAPAGSVLRIVALVGVVRAATYFNAAVFTAVGQPKYRLWLSLTGAAGNVAALFVGLPFGLEGIAIATVARSYLFAPLPFVILSRLIGLSPRRYLSATARPLGPTLLMAAALAGLRLALPETFSPAMRLALLVPAGALAYGLFMLLLAPGALADLLRLATRAFPRVQPLTGPALGFLDRIARRPSVLGAAGAGGSAGGRGGSGDGLAPGAGADDAVRLVEPSDPGVGEQPPVDLQQVDVAAEVPLDDGEPFVRRDDVPAHVAQHRE